MSDLNIFHAQNADLKSRVSDSGLACDSSAIALDRKDIEAFELAMRGGEKNLAQSGLAFESSATVPDHKCIDASRLVMKEGNQNFCDFPMHKQEEKNGSSSLSIKPDFNSEFDQAHSDALPQAPLSALFSMVSTFNDVQATARVDAPHAILSESDLNMLVERILVSAANDGTQEVRLILNESVLSGTEIVLNRNNSGQLVVALHCTDASTFQTLVGAQFELKNRLEVHEVGAVQVSVDIHQEGNDAGQRSRGYFEYDPEQIWKRDNA